MTTTRRRILDAALRVFAQKGYHQTRMEDIVQEARMSKGGVYHHFPGKAHLFLALMDEFGRLLEHRLREAVEGAASDTERLVAALRTGLELLETYQKPARLVFLQASGLGSAFEEKRLAVFDRLAAFIQEELDRAAAHGLIAQDIRTDIVAHAWVGALYEWAVRWFLYGSPGPREVLPAFTAFFLRSLGRGDLIDRGLATASSPKKETAR